jgi:cytochrome c-type biogenesis protein CcmH/NrfG
MRRLLWCSAVALIIFSGASTPLCAQFYQQRSQAAPVAQPSYRPIIVPQFGQTNRLAAPRAQVHQSVTPPPAVTPSVPSTPQHEHHGNHHQGVAPSAIFWGGYPLIWGSGFAPVFVPVYANPYAFAPNFVVPPPVAQPAPADPVDAPPRDAPAKRKPKATSAEQKGKAGKFIAFGDANFANHKYIPAVERYKTASQVAPDLPETYLRQGHALVALGQYENASKAFKRGLRMRSDWSDWPFRLDQLYAQDPLAKTSHIETLAKAVESNPLDSTLLFDLGMQLYFDGQHERAAVFFARVAELGGNEERLLNDLLPKPAPAGAAVGKIVF